MARERAGVLAKGCEKMQLKLFKQGKRVARFVIQKDLIGYNVNN